MSQQKGTINHSDSMQASLAVKVTEDSFLSTLDSAINYVDLDNEKALEILQQAERQALQSSDTSWIVLCWRIKGQILYRLERSAEAEKMFQTALPIAERHNLHDERFRIFMSFGANFTFRSQYDKALRNFFAAREIANIQNDTIHLEMVLQNIGVVYYKLKNYTKALFYWKSARRCEVSLKRSAYDNLMNISLCYANLLDFENARKSLDESIRLCGDQCPYSSMVHIKYASGYIYLGLKDYSSAESDFLESYEYARSVCDVRMELDNIYLLAKIYQDQDKMEKALMLLKDAEKLIQNGAPYNLEIIKIYSRLSEFYIAQKNFEKAALYQAKYISLRDSIYSEVMTTNLMTTESEELERVNEAQIAAQKEVIALKEEAIVRQRTLNIVAFLLAAIAFVLVFFIHKNSQQKKYMNLKLDELVKQRTKGFEDREIKLLRTVREQAAVADRMTRELCDMVTTIRGLCNTAKAEILDELSLAYIERIDQFANRLMERLNLVKSQSGQSYFQQTDDNL